MTALLLILDAPMQSWGVRSRFTVRDTATEPSKSGVVGLLAAALGIPRDADDRIRALATLRMGVRVDREGVLAEDYHTAQGVIRAREKPFRDRKDGLPPTPAMRSTLSAVVSRRAYLSDAVFLVALEEPQSPSHLLPALPELHTVLRSPHWPLYLGRRSFVPARPVVDADPAEALSPLSLDEILHAHPWQGAGIGPRPQHLRTIIDTDPTARDAELRYDLPVSFRSEDRRYHPRYVRTFHVPCPQPRAAR
ncbi:CRISPR system Cascade subunit CasD [Thermocatellispora tengchongensis]|uniref:CRISPR system Cascade subunit CasD n=1 Tax=Thermocatellispora tengchongensis TaxID=1073253 RepID=A0A840PEQ9_9ACTN|nr:type I-E CRISPR-associated protein Cas5/CasD [Thermocatellispora tengchongensis]MBB5137246.1 CRISPR system Cascade subunit CasD [Thermocatellispora tengchongensis]